MRKGLLIGAGFSFDFAMPLVWELTEEFRTKLPYEKFHKFNQKWKSEGHGYSDKAMSLYRSLMDDKRLHYEQIVGALEVYARRHENRSIQQEIHSIRQWVMEMIYWLLYERQIKNLKYNELTLQHYRGIKSLTKQGYPLWIFSLNHDMVVESLASYYDISIRNGFWPDKKKQFKSNVSSRTVEFLGLDEDDFRKRGLNFFNKVGDEGINLLKIHGSLDNFAFNDGKEYISIDILDKKYVDVIDELKELNSQPYPDSFVKVTNELVLKDLKGTEQFLRRSLLSGVFKFKKSSPGVVPTTFLQQFRQNVNFCEELDAIGYGFGDSHINEVLRNWLESNSHRRLTVFLPNEPDLGFVGHLRNQVEFKRSYTIDYISSLPGGSLSGQEIGMNQTRAKIRRSPWFAEFQKFRIYGIVAAKAVYSITTKFIENLRDSSK